MGNIELYRKTQCPTCLKHSKEGTIYCGCGKCLMPSPGQREKIKNRTDILADLQNVVKRVKAGERHGPEEWHYHHWKAADASRNGRKREYESVAKKWIEDPDYRVTQQIHGWTVEYCMFLDCLKTIKINYKVIGEERDRYKNQFVLRWEDSKNPGKISIQAVKSSATMAHQKGRGNA